MSASYAISGTSVQFKSHSLSVISAQLVIPEQSYDFSCDLQIAVTPQCQAKECDQREDLLKNKNRVLVELF